MTIKHRRLDCPEKQKTEIVDFYFNDRKLTGFAGEPIAVALLANGIKTIRNCEVTGENRGIYCGIGHCYECRAVVNDNPNVRTCLTPVQRDMKVFSSVKDSQVRGDV